MSILHVFHLGNWVNIDSKHRDSCEWSMYLGSECKKLLLDMILTLLFVIHYFHWKAYERLTQKCLQILSKKFVRLQWCISYGREKCWVKLVLTYSIDRHNVWHIHYIHYKHVVYIKWWLVLQLTSQRLTDQRLKIHTYLKTRISYV